MELRGQETFEKKLYTGLSLVEPIAVNPTQEEATALGLGNVLDYAYLNEEGKARGRTVIYVKTTDTPYPITRRLVFDISTEEYESKSGNKMFINPKMQFKYGASLEAIIEANDKEQEEWKKIDINGLKPAKQGEFHLLKFIYALSNWKQGKSLSISMTDEDIENIVRGNSNDVRDIIFGVLKDNKVYVLLGVDEEREQIAVYQNAISMKNPYLSISDAKNAKTLTSFYKAVADEEYGWDRNFQKDKYMDIEDETERAKATLKLQEFNSGEDTSFV